MWAPVQRDAGFIGLDKGIHRRPDDGLRHLLAVDESLMRPRLRFLFGVDLGRHFRECGGKNGDLPAAIRRQFDWFAARQALYRWSFIWVNGLNSDLAIATARSKARRTAIAPAARAERLTAERPRFSAA